MSRFRPLLCAALLSSCAAALLPAQSVQLTDGRILLASVESANGDGLRVQRLDNGGLLELRWEQLATSSAMAIKRRFELVGDAETEVLVRVDEVEYSFQGTKKVIAGRIVEATNDRLVVQNKGVQYPVRRADLRGVRKVDMPVTQVLTKDEYYQQLLAEQPPGEEADRHVRLAELLIQVRDYAHAGDELQKAKELGNSRNPQQIDTLLARLSRFRDAEKELGLLEQIQASRGGGRPADFERGMKLIAQFEKDFPQSKLKAEFDAEKRRFTESRKRVLSQLVANEFRRMVGAVAEKKVDEAGCTLDAAREYAQAKMTEDILARVAQLVKVDPADIKQLWAARAEFPIGKRPDQFDYGAGSWVLGEQGIVKNTDSQAANKAAAAEEDKTSDREMERFRKVMQEAMRNRMRSMQAQGGEQQEEQTEEGWWQSAARGERISWLRAFYAENGGQLVVRNAFVSSCITCYGAGNTLSITSDGKPQRSKCPMCHGTKLLRSLKAY